MNPTMKQADMALLVKPGTDGALACAVMHVLFRDGYADWDYLNRYTDHPRELEQHLRTRDPVWAAAITGLPAAEIEAFAKLVGERKRTYFRLGYGFARQRNGTVNMHAASCIAAVTGAWRHEGGGAFHINNAIYHWNKRVIEGHDALDPTIRKLDQSQIGRVLTGDAQALYNGPPVKALIIQNTNPVTVAPEQELVKKGFAREDLFVCVHEQFMTETARMADIVLPATMFMEHDDLYAGGGHQYFQVGAKLVEPPGECRSNHDVICDLARRVGAEHRGFHMTPRELIDATLKDSGWEGIDALERQVHVDAQPHFEDAHYLKGFAYPDGKFRFKPDWTEIPSINNGSMGPWQSLPEFPDHWAVIEEATDEHPFRLATSPSRNFLNSTFTETPTSKAKERRPEVIIHPDDAAAKGIADGDVVKLKNTRGEVFIHARLFDGVRRGVLIAESIWPNAAHIGGCGINTLTGADQVAPYGGAAFHDNRVALEKASI
jgi:anaerobic selenocysteine-containing dehydrogenase